MGNARFLSDGHSRRVRTTYEANCSAALSLPYSTEILEEKSQSLLSLLELSQDHIIEHAARRVDLLFYLMVAVYKKMITLYLSKTKLQHGIGRYPLTQACHSNFFPHPSRKENGQYEDLLFNQYFNDSLNSTVELPECVNLLDDYLEQRFEGRTKMLEVLQQVSLGRMTPQAGLAAFFRFMDESLSALVGNESFLGGEPEAKKLLLDSVRIGTFNNHWNEEEKSVNDEYIHMMLRLNGKRHVSKKQLRERIFEIQREICGEISETSTRSPMPAKYIVK